MQNFFPRHNLIGFALNNFRVFEKKIEFELAPITILTGTNNSGKSTFTKALNLLTKSYRKNGLRKLELMDSDLKLGDFESIINFKKEPTSKSQISFELKIETCGLYEHNLKKFTVCFSFIENGLKVLEAKNDKNELLLCKSGEIDEYGRYKITKSFIKLSEDIIDKEKLRSLFSNFTEDEFQNICDLILYFLENNIQAHQRSDELYEVSYDKAHYDVITEFYKNVIDGLSVIGEVDKGKRAYVDFELKEEIEYEYQNELSANPRLKELFPDDLNSKLPDHIKEEFLYKFIRFEKIEKLDLIPLDLLSKLFNQFDFIDGVRAKQDLIYTKENAPLFYNILEDYFNKKYFTDSSFLKKWLVDEFKLIDIKETEELQDVLKVQPIIGYGYVIQFLKDNKPLHLSRLGYGVTQLLPILIRVALAKDDVEKRNNIVVIEEPESNLHPALQSKLADIFAELIKDTNIQLIIETHSEYLIRKLQYLIVNPNNNLLPQDIIIYYFYPSYDIPPSEKQVKKINIQEDGSLTDDFGNGFFDEADKVAISIWSMNQSQKN